MLTVMVTVNKYQKFGFTFYFAASGVLSGQEVEQSKREKESCQVVEGNDGISMLTLTMSTQMPLLNTESMSVSFPSLKSKKKLSKGEFLTIEMVAETWKTSFKKPPPWGCICSILRNQQLSWRMLIVSPMGSWKRSLCLGNITLHFNQV